MHSTDAATRWAAECADSGRWRCNRPNFAKATVAGQLHTLSTIGLSFAMSLLRLRLRIRNIRTAVWECGTGALVTHESSLTVFSPTDSSDHSPDRMFTIEARRRRFFGLNGGCVFLSSSSRGRIGRQRLCRAWLFDIQRCVGQDRTDHFVCIPRIGEKGSWSSRNGQPCPSLYQ